MRAPLVAAAVAGMLVVLVGCGGSTTSGTTATSAASASATPIATTGSIAPKTSATTTTAATTARHRRHRPSPGSLPQTQQLPPAHGALFRAHMAALWAGVKTGAVAPALPAFFPEGAYTRVKAVADPHADYVARLIGDYRLDLGAAHALLGASPRRAALVGADVPGAYAHWVQPGACYNRVGYYEVPNARLVYRAGGEIRSFGIASMISWRGVWYVVHLGAVTRSGGGGVVDAPSAGRGLPAASSTC